MPLRDHFHPPLSSVRHWESFHARWASVIAEHLEASLLPEGYFAEVQVHLGNRVEIDIAAFEDSQQGPSDLSESAKAQGAVAVASPQIWSPPAPTMTMPAVFPDRIEILIHSSESGPTVVSAIELVSPANKDRASHRSAFATKCANYLRLGISLMVVDVVTSRTANLHNSLIELMGLDASMRLDEEARYCVAYAPLQTSRDNEIRVWAELCEVGKSLPVLPLSLDRNVQLRLDLEETYADACQRMRMP